MPDESTKKLYYTIEELSKIFGVHKETVRKWIRTGKLQAKKTATNRWYVPAESLDSIFNEEEARKHTEKNVEAAHKLNKTLSEKTEREIATVVKKKEKKDDFFNLDLDDGDDDDWF
jgi:excisionase family DNA binding protein